MKLYREKITTILNEQVELQKSLGIDMSESNRIIQDLKTGELIVAVVGEINRGKSTFLNALMGDQVFPSRATVCTAGVTVLDNGDEPQAEIIYTNGKKEKLNLPLIQPAVVLSDYISRTNKNVRGINSLNIKFPNQFSGNGILLVDTPGVNDPENWREEITYNYLGAADAVIMLLDPGKPLSASETEFLKDKILDQSIEKLIFVVNKIDNFPIADRIGVMKRIKSLLSQYVTSPEIHAVSSKDALKSKLNNDDSLFVTSGFKKFEEFLLDFLMKGRGGALLETKINRGLVILGNIDDNINNRNGSLDSEKDVVKKKLSSAKRELTIFEKKKKTLKKNISSEHKNITKKLESIITSKQKFFNSTVKPSIINEPSLQQLRVKVLNFQKEIIKLFGDTVNKANKQLVIKYRTDSVGIMSDVKQILSSLGNQAISSAQTLKVNNKQQTTKKITDNTDIKTGATVGGAVGGVLGAAAASQAVFATSAGLMAFTTLGTFLMGALTGGLGLIAGAGIAAYLKKQKKENMKSNYIESNEIVNNDKAAIAVQNFLKGMKSQSKVVGGMIVHSFIEQAIVPLETQFTDQGRLINIIENDLKKTVKDQDLVRQELEAYSNKSNDLRKDYDSILSQIIA